MSDPSRLAVVPLPILDDNYVFAVRRRAGGPALLVDPGSADEAIEWLSRERCDLGAVLVTHHHRDHVGGVEALARRYRGVPVIAPASDRARIPGVTVEVREGDRPGLPIAGCEVLELPGHTSGHVGYFFPDGANGGDLFSGDTVFGATIGNLFEGTPDDIFGALVKIRALPERTRIWCAHEYTLVQVRETLRFDRENTALRARLASVEARVSRGEPTVPLTLAEERATNPFFRWDDPALTERLGTAPGLATFRRLCELL